MANRIATHILKHSNVIGRPLPSSLLGGEPIVNTADGIMYFSGVTASSNGWTPAGTGGNANFFEVGSNLYDLQLRNRITKYEGATGASLVGKFLSGTTNGFVLANIAEIAGVDTYVTGFTYSNNVATIKQNIGKPDLSITINTMTGLTVNGILSATTGNFGTTNITNANINTLGATAGTITTLGSTTATLGTANITNGNITTLGATGGTITTLGSTTATLGTANVTNANITTLGATGATITTLSATTYLGLPISIVNTSNLFSTGLVGTGLNASGVTESNFFGPNAGRNASNAPDSNFMGRDAGNGATNASYSNFFGPSAGQGAVGGSFSNFIGNQAGQNATNANSSNFLGSMAGYGASSASNSNFLGSNAGNSATNANNSNFLGNNAGINATNASSSTFIGLNAGDGAINANHSLFIGEWVGYQAVTASGSTFIGTNAGQYGANANNSNFIGQYAGQGAANASGSTFMGYSAGYNAAKAAYSNIFGYNAGYASNPSLSIGRNNIIIGTNISLSAGTTNAINLGGVLFGTGTYSNQFGSVSLAGQANGKIGVNVPTPLEALHVSGNTLINGNLTANIGNLTTANITTLNATGGTVTTLDSTTLNLGKIAKYSGLTNLSGKFLSGTTSGFELANIADIIGVDTYVTGFTYSPTTNTITLSQNVGQAPKTVSINTVSGLTVSDLTANRLVYTTTSGKLVTNSATFDGTNMTLPTAGSLTVGTGGISTTGSVVIGGDLTVLGASVSAFTSQLYVEDNNVFLNYNPTGVTTSTSVGAGWTIQDGNGIAGGNVNLDVRAMNTFTGLTSTNIPNISEYSSSTGYANRAFVTQLNDIVIRSTSVSTPNGVRVLAEFDIIDGGVY